MKPKFMVILEHAVSTGTEYGLRRFYKHRDIAPTEAELVDMAASVAEYVMLEIATWFETSEDSNG